MKKLEADYHRYEAYEDRTDKSTHKIEAETKKMLRDKYVAALDIIQKQVEQIQELERKLGDKPDLAKLKITTHPDMSKPIDNLKEMLFK